MRNCCDNLRVGFSFNSALYLNNSCEVVKLFMVVFSSEIDCTATFVVSNVE